MFVDEVGGEKVAGVYCTLCGTITLYNTVQNGIHYELGTSRFLYRSNKLMYDKKTQPLWNTIQGTPVIGPLVDQDIELATLSVVTTTWGEWRKRHPNTSVLSLKTGHERDYSEGAAYANYFATDKLMFNVPKTDNRLKNKSEVLIVRAPNYQNDPLAISVDFLTENRLYYNKIRNTKFVVVTDKSGANRVYESPSLTFTAFKDEQTIVDNKQGLWKVYEDRLENKLTSEILPRLSYHRAFWFGWYAVFPETRLVK